MFHWTVVGNSGEIVGGIYTKTDRWEDAIKVATDSFGKGAVPFGRSDWPDRGRKIGKVYGWPSFEA